MYHKTELYKKCCSNLRSLGPQSLSLDQALPLWVKYLGGWGDHFRESEGVGQLFKREVVISNSPDLGGIYSRG